MTSPQTQARSDLKDLLVEQPTLAGFQVFTHWPEKATAPIIVVGPGFPYVEFPGATFGGRRIRMSAIVVLAKASNDLEAAALDEAIDAVLAAVDESENFAPGEVGSPGPVPLNGQKHLGVSVEVITEV